MAIGRPPVGPEIQDPASARPIPIRCECDLQDRFSTEMPVLDGPRFFGIWLSTYRSTAMAGVMHSYYFGLDCSTQLGEGPFEDELLNSTYQKG